MKTWMEGGLGVVCMLEIDRFRVSGISRTGSATAY
jgi:hypothetical protein